MKKTALPEVNFVTQPNYDEDGVQVSSGIRPDGKEANDPVPMEPPIGYNAPPDLMTMIRTMIQSEQLRQELAREDFETFEEADDFDIEDDPLDPLTEYEAVFNPPPSPPTAVPLERAAQQPPSQEKHRTEVLDTSVLGDTSQQRETPTKPSLSNSNPSAKGI